MVFHPVLMKKNKINLGSKVNHKQAGGTLHYLPDFNFFLFCLLNNDTPAKGHPFMADAAGISFINRPLKYM